VSPQRGPVLPYKLIGGVTPVRKKWLVASAKMAGSTFAPEEARLLDTFREVVDMRPSFSAILVNAPIGYRDRQIDPQRQCDIEARKLLGRRGVVIRRVPSREVLTRDIALESDHLDAVTRTMLPVVIQVSQEMSAYRQRAVYEGEPELSFYWLNGETPLRWSKMREEGRQERRALLEARVPGIERIIDSPLRGVKPHHLLDAAALLTSARRAQVHAARRIPLHPEWDSEGLRMEYVY
jgi:predicted RNase H-like nuclease